MALSFEHWNFLSAHSLQGGERERVRVNSEVCIKTYKTTNTEYTNIRYSPVVFHVVTWALQDVGRDFMFYVII